MEYNTDHSGNTFTKDENDRFHSYGDKPAFINQYEEQWWFEHGKQHRLEGPAVISVKGGASRIAMGKAGEFYYIDDIAYTKAKWEKHPDVQPFLRAKKIKKYLDKKK